MERSSQPLPQGAGAHEWRTCGRVRFKGKGKPRVTLEALSFMGDSQREQCLCEGTEENSLTH